MLRLPQVIDATGLGKTTIYALQAEGDFPMRVKITAHSVAWVEEDVQAWLAARIERARSESAAPRTQRPQATRRKER
jgi:prophage regulatory protein